MANLAETIGQLEAVGGFAEMMQLFRRNSPRQFERRIVARGITPLAGFNQMAVALDDLCIALDSRFPISASGDWLAEQMMEGGFPPYLPVTAAALIYDGITPDDLRLGYRVIYAATTDPLGDLMMRPIVGAQLGHHPDCDDVAALCASKRGALRYLVDAYRYAHAETRNCFLDISEEELGQCEPVEFSQQQIDCLTREWKAAQPILRRCDRFNDWIEADLRRVKTVVNLLRQASAMRKPERVRVWAQTADEWAAGYRGTPLVEQMGDWLDEPDDEDYDDEEI